MISGEPSSAGGQEGRTDVLCFQTREKGRRTLRPRQILSRSKWRLEWPRWASMETRATSPPLMNLLMFSRTWRTWPRQTPDFTEQLWSRSKVGREEGRGGQRNDLNPRGFQQGSFSEAFLDLIPASYFLPHFCCKKCFFYKNIFFTSCKRQ